MPFWRAADGTLRELEGSFARYVDSLAPYFDEISLCVPVLARADREGTEGTAVRAPNVTLAPLPAFAGPVQFYPRLPLVLPRLAAWARRIDLLHCRVPTPAAAFAFAAARWMRIPSFLLVVGDLRALLPSMPYRGAKRALWRAYTEFEERSIRWMARTSLTFANGPALAAKHAADGVRAIETTTTTIGERDISTRADTCGGRPVRALTVSRIDPRKGLRVLPAAIRRVVDAGTNIRLDIVGPTVGAPGEMERAAIVDEAARCGVANRVALAGALPLDRLLPAYRDYDLFVLPTLPGEGIPRVLLEAMSAGLPIVASRVAGIPGLVTHESNGLLVDEPTSDAVGAAMIRIVRDGSLRRTLIANGYETARAFTLEAQAAKMMAEVERELHVVLRHPNVVPAA